MKMNLKQNEKDLEYIAPVNGIVQPPIKPPPEKPTRRTDVLDKLREVVNKLFAQSHSYHFRYPVDAVALKIPDYHKIVKYPMDLNTIRQRFHYTYYNSGVEAKRDIELVFHNCMIYNPQGTAVYLAGKKLESEYQAMVREIDMSDEKEVKKRRKKLKKRDKKRSKIDQQQTNAVESAVPGVPVVPAVPGVPVVPAVPVAPVAPVAPAVPVAPVAPKGLAEMPFYNEPKLPNEPHSQIDAEPESEPDNEKVNEPDKLESQLRLLYEWQHFLIEKHHCEQLLEELSKKKRFNLNWPFINADHWRCFGRNPRYDHEKMDKLDWGVLKSRLEHHKFNNFNEFVEKIREMFQNALTCFATDTNVVDSVFKLNEFMESRLSDYKRSIEVIKLRIRRLANEKIKDFEYAMAQKKPTMDLLNK